MFLFQDRPVSIMVFCCIALHLWWAFLVSIDVSATGATALNALYRVSLLNNTNVLSASLASVSVLAIVALFANAPWTIWFLIPQQIVLFISASGAISAIWLSQFADGVLRPRAFIAADQGWVVLLAFSYTLAIVAHARRRGF